MQASAIRLLREKWLIHSSYPGVGYPQQQGFVGYQQEGYAMYQQPGQYPAGGYYNDVPANQVVANPYITTSPQPYNHQTMAHGGYNHQHEGTWNDKDKHQHGWYGYNCNNAMANGGYNQRHEGPWNDKNKQQSGRYGYNGNGTIASGGSGSNSHESSFPGAPNKTQAGGYGYGSTWGSGSQGCQKVEYWAVKGV